MSFLKQSLDNIKVWINAETDDQEVDGAGRAYCCQIIHAQETSYDHGIYQIIELLE